MTKKDQVVPQKVTRSCEGEAGGYGDKSGGCIEKVMRSSKGFGRVRMRLIPDVAGSGPVPFASDDARRRCEILTH